MVTAKQFIMMTDDSQLKLIATMSEDEISRLRASIDAYEEYLSTKARLALMEFARLESFK